MSTSTVRDAFRTRIAALIASTLTTWNYIETVNAGPESERPSGDEKFITLEFIGGTERPESVGAPGSNLHRENGTVLIQMFAIRGSGHGDLESACDSVRGTFRAYRTGNLKVFNVNPPSTVDDDGFYRAQIAVDYEFDTFG